MQSQIFSFFFLLFVHVAYADPPEICNFAPAITLQPGTLVSARLSSQGKRCEATVAFTNPDFLPLRYGFKALDCLGFLAAEFTVPPEVPNGDAFIMWQCADQSMPTCTKAMISGGSQDPDNIVFNNYGTISCLVPLATETTLVTSIGSMTTAVQTIVSTVFSESGGAGGSAMPIPTESLSALGDTSFSVTESQRTLATTASGQTGVTIVPISTETLVSISTGSGSTVTETHLSTIFSTSTLVNVAGTASGTATAEKVANVPTSQSSPSTASCTMSC